MKTVKYRAWDKFNKIMLYDVQNAYDFMDGIPSRNFGDALEDQDYEIMQYIGLEDKNGKEVYEGDILIVKDCYCKDGQFFVGYVDFACASFFIKNEYSSNYRWMDYEFVVLGNIHEDYDLYKTYIKEDNEFTKKIF